MINGLFVILGYRPKLSMDLNVAEALCKYGSPRLGSYPYLSPTLPEFDYGSEGV